MQKATARFVKHPDMKNSVHFLFVAPVCNITDSTVQNLYFSPILKGANFKPERLPAVRTNSFYIYRNCVYRIIPSRGHLDHPRYRYPE